MRTLKKPWQIVVGTWKGTPFYTGRLMVHASNRRNLFKPMRDCATAHFMEHHRAVRSSVHRLAIYIGSGWREVGRMHAKRWMVGSRRVRNVEFVTFRAAA